MEQSTKFRHLNVVVLKPKHAKSGVGQLQTSDQ